MLSAVALACSLIVTVDVDHSKAQQPLFNFVEVDHRTL